MDWCFWSGLESSLAPMILLDLHPQEYSNSYNTLNDCFPIPVDFIFFCLRQRDVIFLQILMIPNHTRIFRANEFLTFYTNSTHTIYGIRHHDDIILQVWAPTHITIVIDGDNTWQWGGPYRWRFHTTDG